MKLIYIQNTDTIVSGDVLSSHSSYDVLVHIIENCQNLGSFLDLSPNFIRHLIALAVPGVDK